MSNFLYGFQWGLGFFCAAFIFLVVALVFLVGILGLGQLRKAYPPFQEEVEKK